MNEILTNDFSKQIWRENYKVSEEGSVEDTFRRVAKAVSLVLDADNILYFLNRFFLLMKNLQFVPGGRILANIGVKERQGTTLMNCFVHTPELVKDVQDVDSLSSIYLLLKRQAHTLGSLGGYGTNVSYIRPLGSYVRGMGGRTPGVMVFLLLYNVSAQIITKGSQTPKGLKKKFEKNKIRKGAQLACLLVWHPDIINFIKAKRYSDKFAMFNFSVGIVDGFMDAVVRKEKWQLIFPDTTFEKYNTLWDGNIQRWKEKGYPIVVHNLIQADLLWNLIMTSTYNWNDPGVLFLDKANYKNPLQYGLNVKTSNPCGLILMSTGVCNLGSLILPYFLDLNLLFDFNKFKQAIHLGIRFLDNINDISRVPLDLYKKSMLLKRRVGLGTMGLGSLLLMKSLRYGSKESLDLVYKIYKFKALQLILASALLGKLKGSFPLFDKDKYFNTPWWKELQIDLSIKKTVEELGTMRNSHRSASAPNGNLSILCNVMSGGIEPVIGRSYIRNITVVEQEVSKLVEEGIKLPNYRQGLLVLTEHFKFITQGKDKFLRGQFNGQDYEVDLNRGLIKKVLVDDFGWNFIRSHYNKLQIELGLKNGLYSAVYDDNPLNALTIKLHLDVLKIISHYTDLNNSKTVNVPNNCSLELFKTVYKDAWDANIKGITTYRLGTMTAVLLQKKEDKQYQNLLLKTFELANGDVIIDDVHLPNLYYAKGFKIKDINRKKWYVTIAFSDSAYKKPFALFVRTNSKLTNEVTTNVIESILNLLISKNINRLLIEEQRLKYNKHESNTDKIARAIGMCLRHNIQIKDIVSLLDKYNDGVSTFLFHIKKLISRYIPLGTKSDKTCSLCGGDLVYIEGCVQCMNCGFSKCG